MENQIDYYTETGEYRNRFDQGLPVMPQVGRLESHFWPRRLL